MTQSIVYLLDDEPDLLELLATAVSLAGLQAQKFSQASRFFEQVTHFEPNSILVLDLNMPEIDGIEVMRRLAKLDSPPALILMSGHDLGVLHSAEKLARAHDLDIIACHRKPVSLDQFQQLLEQHASSIRKTKRAESLAGSGTVSLAELKHAIRSGQLRLHYQPQFDIASRKLMGVEALVRWQHPSHGLIFPDRFIALAEQGGLIGELTHWVINDVIQQGQQWQKAGFKIAISVNISAADIISLTLPEQLSELLAEGHLETTQLTLEVTESALMGEAATALDILTRLRLKGIGLSIDDFGTGYSSLSQLHKMPFNELKVDRSFVSNMTEDAEARAIVRTCIILGHELHMLVVAEGVETAEQLELLHSMGCDVAQGYYFSKPVPAEQIITQLRNS